MYRLPQHTRHRLPPSSFLLPPSLSYLLFSSLSLLLLLPLSLVSSQTAPTLYDSPVCLDADFLKAEGLPVPPTNRPPLILERDGWAGHWLTTALAAHILRDALGYPIQVVDVSSSVGQLSSVYSRLGTGVVQMNWEVWPNSQQQADYTDYVLSGQSINAGPLGLLQQSGWYTPTRLVNANWTAYFDFWKGYRYDDLAAYGFLPSGTTPDHKKVGTGREYAPPWCVWETTPTNCSASYYNVDYLERRCNITRYNPYCIEMWAIDALQYDPGVLQQQIYNLHLNITLPFIGDWNYHTMVAAAMVNNVSVLTYAWTPSIETSMPTLSRVALPPYSDACWDNNQTSSLYFDGIGSVNCDFPSQSILKYYSESIVSDSAYTDAITLISRFNFANRYQQSLLPPMAALGKSMWQQYVDNSTCQWLHTYVKLWSTWVTQSPQQSIQLVPTAAWIVVVVCLGVAAAYSLLLHIFWYTQRHHPLVMSSSPLFGQVIISGSWFLYVAVGIMAWKQVDGVCSIIPVFLCLSYILVVGTLLAKTWRLNRIFHGAQLKSVRVSAWDVLGFIAILFTYDFIINTAWIAVDRPVPTLTTDSTNSLWLVYTCSSQYYAAWYVLLIVPKALLLCYGAFLAYNVRHISQNFNESRYIALAILHLLLLGAILVPLDQALASQLTVHYLLITLVLILCVSVTLSLIFLPKIYAILYKKKGKRLRAKDDVSKEDPQPAHGPGHRWLRERALEGSDSGKLSFPSLVGGGGFTHAMKLVRLVAENLYREHGIGEYWQFCVAVRQMSQQELEARAPLLVQYLNNVQRLQATPTVDKASEEEKVLAELTSASADPLSQNPALVHSYTTRKSYTGRGDIELGIMPAHREEEGREEGNTHHTSYPITQASYSAPQSHGTASLLLALPPLPAEAWTVDAGQAAMVEKAVQEFVGTPSGTATAPVPPHWSTAGGLDNTVATTPVSLSGVSSPLSWPLTGTSLPVSQDAPSSYVSQASFSASHPPAGGGHGSQSFPSPQSTSTGSSARTPSSLPNHHSSTSSAQSDSGSRGSGEEGVVGRGGEKRKGGAGEGLGRLEGHHVNGNASSDSLSSGYTQ